MDFNIEIRKKQLDNLDQLISSSRSRIQSVLSYLDWTQENVEKGDPLVQCPVNPHHRIDPKSWNEHIEKCVVKIEGYSSNSQFLSESLDNPTQSIYIDRNKKIELITKELAEKGALRLEKDYNFDEVKTQLNIKISIFINNTEGPPPPAEFTTLYDKKRDEEKPLTYEEILAQERDSKRRRAKYKSVHINRKNHTEVIREVINGQMEEYKEWLLAKEQTKDNKECNNGVHDDKKEEIERPHSSTSRNSSSSRSTNRKYDRHRDERDRSRKRYVRSRSRERSYRSEERNCEERRNRRNRSGDRRRSRERDRRYSSRDRSRRSFSDVRRR